MPACRHPFQGRMRPSAWTLSLLLIAFSTFSSLSLALSDTQEMSSENNHLGSGQLTKLGISGETLDMQAQQWSCVKDKQTGLMWEKRDPSSALQGLDTFIWYQLEQVNAGDQRAHPNLDWADSTCYGFSPNDPASFCNTSAYTERVNHSNYCGYSDWRLPAATELLTLVDPTRKKSNLKPLLDTRIFPFHDPFLFWTNTVNEDGTVITIFNDDNMLENSERSDTASIRLVRGNLDQYFLAVN